MLDEAKLQECIRIHPMLVSVLRAGAMSRKMARNILDLDKWLMDELYITLMLAGAIRTSQSGYFKATPECLEYIRKEV